MPAGLLELQGMLRIHHLRTAAVAAGSGYVLSPRFEQQLAGIGLSAMSWHCSAATSVS
jgi:hypothetical protein